MKAIRRSLKGDKEKESKHQHQNSLQAKSAIAIIPPKKVIKALYDYEPQNKNGQELAFHKGDFFHVLSREDDTEWYEACNPLIPTARGLVPVAFFEVIGKQQRQSGASVRTSDGHDSGFSEKGTTAHTRNDSSITTTMPTHSRGPSATRTPGAMVYGVVLYDFNAERADELDARSGEPVIVVAQSNPEWFVAKPIGRLGGPGLIPVSFVEIKDTATGKSVADPLEAVRAAGVPRVEEWKKTAADYKNSSITLGQLTSPQQQQQFHNNQQQQQRVQQMSSEMERVSLQRQQSQPRQPQPAQQTQQQPPPQQQNANPAGLAPISASVPRYCFDNDMYWYIIECQMEDGRYWELARYYADFYDFQIALLDKFPEEAGNKGKPRSLPFMPGPVAHVTDAISNGRRQNLDEYIKKVVSMPEHISKCDLVRKLFKPKPGQDYEIDASAMNEDYRLSGQSLQPVHSRQSTGTANQSTPAQSGGYGVMPPPASGSARSQHQRAPNSYSGGQNSNGMIMSNSLPPQLHNQASTLTQASASSSMKGAAAAMKVKVFFQDEIFAIRVPQDISYYSLKEKLTERLKINGNIAVQYNDSSGGLVAMINDNDLEDALQRSPKLQLYVNYASG